MSVKADHPGPPAKEIKKVVEGVANWVGPPVSARTHREDGSRVMSFGVMVGRPSRILS
jgi:hypothetical protein